MYLRCVGAERWWWWNASLQPGPTSSELLGTAGFVELLIRPSHFEHLYPLQPSLKVSSYGRKNTSWYVSSRSFSTCQNDVRWDSRAKSSKVKKCWAVLSISFIISTELKERTNKGSTVCQEQENALKCSLHHVARISMESSRVKTDNKSQTVKHYKSDRYVIGMIIFLFLFQHATQSKSVCPFLRSTIW